MALSVKQMGCVIVVLLIQDEDAYLTWLGDSRIYMFRDGLEVFRTTDHSVVNELSKIKALSVEDIERYSAIVTKSIMGVESLDAAPIRKVKRNPMMSLFYARMVYIRSFQFLQLQTAPRMRLAN